MKKGFIIGLTAGLSVIGLSVVLASTPIQAILNDQIKVTLDGKLQEFRDEATNEIQYPITYRDRTYLPLRTVANLVGVGVDYDANNNTAMLSSKKYKESQNINFTIGDLIGTWTVVNGDASSNFSFYDEYVILNLADGNRISGTYEIRNNVIGMDFKNSFDDKVNDEFFRFYITAEIINLDKIKIVSSPKYLPIGSDDYGYSDENSNLFNQTGKVYQKDTTERVEKMQKMIGTWNLQDEFKPQNYTVESRITFDGEKANYVGSYSYGVEGKYTVNGDVVEIYFDKYEALSAEKQNIDEQIVRLRITDNNKLVVIDGSKEEIMYEANVDKNNITVSYRDLKLEDGFVFERASN